MHMAKNQIFNGLAGAAALAGATQAYGSVVNVPLPANITGHAPTASDAGTNRTVDLNGDGQRDLYFRYRNLSESGGTLLLSYFYGGISTAQGAAVGYQISGQAYAFSLSTGYVVGPSSSFYQVAGYLGHIVTNYNGTNYGFTNYLGQAGVPEFIGFKFQTVGGQTDYGYIRLETDPYVSAANPGGIKFLALAYENTGAPIVIPAAVPEPSSLAALAMGAATFAGLGLKRRRTASAAAAH